MRVMENWMVLDRSYAAGMDIGLGYICSYFGVLSANFGNRFDAQAKKNMSESLGNFHAGRQVIWAQSHLSHAALLMLPWP